MSTLAEKPEFRHLMSVSINDERKLDPICLTCNLGDSCLYNNVYFSPDAQYYVLQCEGPKTPRVEIRSTENNSLILDLENNEILEKKISTKAVPRLKKLRVKTSADYCEFSSFTMNCCQLNRKTINRNKSHNKIHYFSRKRRIGFTAGFRHQSQVSGYGRSLRRTRRSNGY